MRPVSIAVLMAGCLPGSLLAESVPESSVRLAAITRHGLELTGEFEIKPARGAPKFVSGSPVSLRLPYGRYTVSFGGPFSLGVSREVEIRDPSTLVILTSDFVFEAGPVEPSSVTLKAAGRTACGTAPLWVKLTGVHSEYTATAEIRSGYAFFDRVPWGTYLLIVIEGKQVLGTYPVDLGAKHVQVEARLAACPAGITSPAAPR